MSMDDKEPCDAWGVPFSKRRDDCARGYHFYGPQYGGMRRCAHCHDVVNADTFFADAVISIIDKGRKP